ncbi:FxDxF family PEP-CTERM protein [Roseateles sp. SL47]|uniref:FxDxF family PEP-CTERM protein n=1 Tax=Roseateles sp. SL47 TaxID=2995138 RepID=UPI0022720F0D|nr:FxDxF family PEP-CTERM protein [Roseateles sp. SL47]WAC72918.1 FxDxF family PEP-CTERM protein [Roseateles sp. SL47]
MQRFIRRLLPLLAAGAVALTAAGQALAQVGAQGLDLDVDLVTGTNGLSYTGASIAKHTEAGSFTDTFHLWLSSTSSVEVSLITTSASDDQLISFSNVWLNGVEVPIYTLDGGDGSFTSFGNLTQLGLSGDVLLTVQGYAGGALAQGTSIAATYTTNFNVITSAVPEPQGAALMLAGLGAVGMVLRRRRKD